MLRWVQTSWWVTWLELVATVITQSDIAFHGWLLWSPTKPTKATLTIPHRGLWCQIGEYWWPLPLNSIEQVQAGDTTLHTFTWPTWQPGQTRYAMLFPSNDPTFLASTSPIWQITAPELPAWILVITEPWNVGLQPWIPEPQFPILVITEPWNA